MVLAEIQKPTFLLSVRRLGLPFKPKLGGFDAIVAQVADERASQVFIELPLTRGDTGRLRMSGRSGPLVEVAVSGAGLASQSLMVIKAIGRLAVSRKPRVWMSADVSLAPLARILRISRLLSVWHQHFPDYTPPGSRFSNPFLSYVYGRFLKTAWQQADLVTMPSERMLDAFSLKFDRKRGNVFIIPNQPPTEVFARASTDGPVPCDCSRFHVLLAASSTDAKFCIEEAVMGAHQADEVHLLVTGQQTDHLSHSEAGDADCVTFLGLLSEGEVQSIARQVDVGLALYRQDPSAHADYGDSLKIRMYASEGLPIIASHHVSPAPEVGAAGGALLVEDPLDWVRPLQTLITDPKTKKRMGSAAYEWASSERCLRNHRLREFGDALEVGLGSP